ncbi:hypothetical protein KKB69_00305 [Patescibacteria group bacterium]|nr:hypothetical protein [Patescibacteria group bacterium]
MPYLEQKDRKNFDPCFEKTLDYLTKLDIGALAGHLNYMVFKTVKVWIGKNGKKYYIFAAIIGTMMCCILEVYRRLIAPYEDKKIKENGDV